MVELLGRIWTLDGHHPAASLVLSEGQVVHVGAPVHGVSRRVVDLDGGVVLPAFVDSHAHPLALGRAALALDVGPHRVGSLAELSQAVALAARGRGLGEWVVGYGYDETQWPEGRAPLRGELDAWAGGRPVFLVRACGHVAVASTAALRAADLWRHDPVGGMVDRDAQGIPVGSVREAGAISRLQKACPPPSFPEWLQAAQKAGEAFARWGVAYVSDLEGGLDATPEWEVYAAAHERGMMGVMVQVFVAWASGVDVRSLPRRWHPHVVLAGVKAVLDGSLSGRTAAVAQAYQGGDDHGRILLSREELCRAASAAVAMGLALAVHAMGERAIQVGLEALAPWAEKAPPPTFTLEHASQMTQEQARRAAQLGIGVSTQPVFAYAEAPAYVRHLGWQGLEATYPLRTWLRQGVRVALSSDAPSTPHPDPANPWLSVHMATRRVTREGWTLSPKERVGRLRALRAYTREAAWLRRLPGRGMLRPGGPADLSIWAQDPFQVEPTAMAPALVTLREGQPIHVDPTWRLAFWDEQGGGATAESRQA
jgi:predicted amidohydrolase YtcJ